MKKWLGRGVAQLLYSHLVGNFDVRVSGDTATSRAISFNPMVMGEQVIRTAEGRRMTRRVEEKCFDKLV